MHSLIVLYTKLSGLSNDRSYYLNLFNHVLFCGKIWEEKNPLFISSDNIEYKSKYVVKNNQ